MKSYCETSKVPESVTVESFSNGVKRVVLSRLITPEETAQNSQQSTYSPTYCVEQVIFAVDGNSGFDAESIENDFENVWESGEDLPDVFEYLKAVDDYRKKREKLLKAFDVYKTNVSYFGIEESTATHTEISAWYRDLLDKKDYALQEIPDPVKRYIKE